MNKINPKKSLMYNDIGDFVIIKRLLVVYFLLLLFEGALRKWFLPGLSNGLLIVRDPIVILIYYFSINQGIFILENKYIKFLLNITIISSIISFVVQAHPITMVYGVRTNLLHFPLIFVMGRVLNWDDVIMYGKLFLIL